MLRGGVIETLARLISFGVATHLGAGTDASPKEKLQFAPEPMARKFRKLFLCSAKDGMGGQRAKRPVGCIDLYKMRKDWVEEGGHNEGCAGSLGRGGKNQKE